MISVDVEGDASEELSTCSFFDERPGISSMNLSCVFRG